MRSLAVVEIENPDDPKGKLVINERDFNPKVHRLFDPLKAQSARAKEVNEAAEAEAVAEPPKEAPAKKAAKKAPAKKAADK